MANWIHESRVLVDSAKCNRNEVWSATWLCLQRIFQVPCFSVYCLWFKSLRTRKIQPKFGLIHQRSQDYCEDGDLNSCYICNRFESKFTIKSVKICLNIVRICLAQLVRIGVQVLLSKKFNIQRSTFNIKRFFKLNILFASIWRAMVPCVCILHV